jgi:hypothetical protein
MKSTEIFKQTIHAYLEQRAASDELFAISYAKPDKSIDQCIVYILHTVQKSGCNGFADEEIYSMAVDFYDKDGIEAGKSTDCKVFVNHTVELTAEEKEEARREAIRRVQDEHYARMKTSKTKPAAKQTTVHNQLSLF